VSELDDLARLIGPSPGEDIRLVQGVIKSWDPDTFENEVDVDGVIRRNLRVGSGIEALTYQPGDVVLVQQWFPGGRKGELGVGTSWIVGRILTPGTDAAEKAVAFMRTTLATSLSAQIFADRIHTAIVAGTGNRDSETFGDLDDQSGPTVSNVEVVSGKAIVLVSARIQATHFMSSATNDGGYVSVEVSGATSLSPRAFGDLRLSVHDLTSDGGVWVRATGSRVVEGLNPGLHTFTLKYAKLLSSSRSLGVSERELIVIAL